MKNIYYIFIIIGLIFLIFKFKNKEKFSSKISLNELIGFKNFNTLIEGLGIIDDTSNKLILPFPIMTKTVKVRNKIILHNNLHSYIISKDSSQNNNLFITEKNIKVSDKLININTQINKDSSKDIIIERTRFTFRQGNIGQITCPSNSINNKITYDKELMMKTDNELSVDKLTKKIEQSNKINNICDDRCFCQLLDEQVKQDDKNDIIDAWEERIQTAKTKMQNYYNQRRKYNLNSNLYNKYNILFNKYRSIYNKLQQNQGSTVQYINNISKCSFCEKNKTKSRLQKYNSIDNIYNFANMSFEDEYDEEASLEQDEEVLKYDIVNKCYTCPYEDIANVQNYWLFNKIKCTNLIINNVGIKYKNPKYVKDSTLDYIKHYITINLGNDNHFYICAKLNSLIKNKYLYLYDKTHNRLSENSIEELTARIEFLNSLNLTNPNLQIELDEQQDLLDELNRKQRLLSEITGTYSRINAMWDNSNEPDVSLGITTTNNKEAELLNSDNKSDWPYQIGDTSHEDKTIEIINKCGSLARCRDEKEWAYITAAAASVWFGPIGLAIATAAVYAAIEILRNQYNDIDDQDNKRADAKQVMDIINSEYKIFHMGISKINKEKDLQLPPLVPLVNLKGGDTSNMELDRLFNPMWNVGGTLLSTGYSTFGRATTETHAGREEDVHEIRKEKLGIDGKISITNFKFKRRMIDFRTGNKFDHINGNNCIKNPDKGNKGWGVSRGSEYDASE